MAQKPTIAPLLGMERVDYEKPPLITEELILWRVVCLSAQAETPTPVAYHRSEERCTQALAHSERSAWPCSACGMPDRDHVWIWTESVPLADAMRTHRVLQLGQAPQEATPPTVNPEELEARRPERLDQGRQAQTPTEAPMTPAPAPKAKRGPHADRLEKARAAHEAATRPKPKVVKPKDPFEVEDL